MTNQNNENKAQARPTTKFTTTNGHEVEIKQWLTGREKRNIQDVFLDGMSNVDVDESKGEPKGSLDPQTIRKAEEVAVQTIIVSLDGDSENIVDRVLDLHETDTEEIVQAANDVYSPKSDEKKLKQLSPDTLKAEDGK